MNSETKDGKNTVFQINKLATRNTGCWLNLGCLAGPQPIGQGDHGTRVSDVHIISYPLRGGQAVDTILVYYLTVEPDIAVTRQAKPRWY